MKQFSKDLGNVSLAPKGKWSREQEYERLALVYNVCDNLSYVAKINVPSGVDIENCEYWQPMNATGYADNNFINLTTENENGTITAYESLEEAVATILPINRRAGATLSFYNLNSDRLDRQAEFELWQFNSTDLANWENRDYWNNVYYNWNVFVGWYIGADALKNHVKLPTVGQYAYVGSNLNNAVLYQCRTNGTWTNTGTKVRNYISVVVGGNITIGDNGNWFSDGKDTGIPATPAVDEQLDNIGLRLQQHATEIDKLQKQDVSLKSNIDSNFETINNKVDKIKTDTNSKIDTANANLQKQITGNDNDIATLNTKHESLSKTVQGIAVTGGASTATNVTYDKTNSGLNAENVQDVIDKLVNSENIKYNNETSDLEAGNVQEAIDEINTKVSDLSIKNNMSNYTLNRIASIEKVKAIDGVYYSPNLCSATIQTYDGSTSPSEHAVTTPYIRVKPSSTFTIECPESYDVDGTPVTPTFRIVGFEKAEQAKGVNIDGGWHPKKEIYNVPANCRYIRLTYRLGDADIKNYVNDGDLKVILSDNISYTSDNVPDGSVDENKLSKELLEKINVGDIDFSRIKNVTIDTDNINDGSITVDKVDKYFTSQLVNLIPSFYKEEYVDTINKVQALQGEGTNSFAFITDLHFGDDKYTYLPIQRMMKTLGIFSKEFPLSVVVSGGDYMQLPDPNTKQMGIDQIMKFNNWMSYMDCPRVAIAGNHEESYMGYDLTAPSWQTTNFGLSYIDVDNLLLKKYATSFGVTKNGIYTMFTKDSVNKLFYLYISTFERNYGKEEIDREIFSALANNTDKFPIIIFNHYSVYREQGVNIGIKNLVDKIKGKGYTIAVWIGGHCHADWSFVYNETLFISCLQSGILSSMNSEDGETYKHVYETDKESAFTIFTINQKLGKLYATRFGLGIDREFNYNTISGTIGKV